MKAYVVASSDHLTNSYTWTKTQIIYKIRNNKDWQDHRHKKNMWQLKEPELQT